jgi:UDP-N-acetylmuramoyl-tripeptide--D-alanyl-D-alanine ligase
MMLSEIANALNAQFNGVDVEVLSVGTDSRNIVNDQLFVAIKGGHFDGNEYAAEAVAKGAAAVLISNEALSITPSVLVQDTRVALGALAHYWRKKFDIPLVAITGSNGKTTVKEMVAAILNAAKGNVLSTKGNLNNDIGMPLTLLSLREAHSCAVIEMGMNHLNEISYLSKLACPQVALVNNAGTAHIGELGSREAIAQAKGEIFEGLAKDGIAVINADDRFAAYWKSLNQERNIITFGLKNDADVSAEYRVMGHQIEIDLKTPNGHSLARLELMGEHNVMNVLAASAVAVSLEIANEDIVQGLAQFNGVQGRLKVKSGLQHATVIDDTYNANLDSMKAAIDVLAAYQAHESHQLIFVMGDMAELGNQSKAMHIEVGEYAQTKGINTFLSFGQMSQLASRVFGANGHHFDVLEDLIAALIKKMSHETYVLVKGSRMMKMERVVEAITQEHKPGSKH